MSAQGLSSRAIIGEFYARLEAATGMSWISQLSMLFASDQASETYKWLGQAPVMREWIGGRHAKGFRENGLTIANKTFEATLEVSVDDLRRDKTGQVMVRIAELAGRTVSHDAGLLSTLILNGATAVCYDGQYFFDTDHPVGAPGSQVSVSNFQGGSGTAWFLMDTTKVLKPIIYQKRRDYAFQAKTSLTDDNVFSRNEFVWGADGRGNVGLGLWQLAYASKQTLDAANYAAARAAHQSIVGDNGKPLVIRSSELWVPPSLEQKALEVVQAERLANGASNVMRGLSKVVVCPWLAA